MRENQVVIFSKQTKQAWKNQVVIFSKQTKEFNGNEKNQVVIT